MSRVIAIKWCFTVNNYKEEDLSHLEALTEYQYMIVGREVASTGTPHLQGFIYLKKSKMFTAVKKLLPLGCHIEQAKGSVEKNIAYCSKEGSYVEFGVKPVVNERQNESRKRNAADMLKDTLNGVEKEDMFKTYGSSYIYHKRNVNALAKEILQERQSKELLLQYRSLQLYPWQEKVVSMLDGQTDRQILFILDVEGGKGKTTFAKYLVAVHKAIYFTNGRSADVKYSYDGQPLVVFDLVRSNEEMVNYAIMEELKNGVFFSTKYESTTKFFKPPKMIVMMNFHPDKAKLSADRYVIVDL